MARRSSSRASSAMVRQGAGLIGRGHWAVGLLLVALGAGVWYFGERGGGADAPSASGGHAPVARGQADLPSAGTVTHCFDGDSFKMKTTMGEQEVRLWGVDAPEHGQPFGEEARAFAKATWEGKGVEVVTDRGTDRYGRRILEMKLKEGPVIQRLLLDRGLAWHYRQYAGERADFAAAEAAARRKRAGLWAGKQPVPPWEWRAEHRR